MNTELPESEPAPGAEHTRPTVPFSRYILLAEDEPDTRELMAESLRLDNFQVVEAENGNILTNLIWMWHRFREPRKFIDVIVTDIWMPGMTGLEVLAELRRIGRTTPVVLVTAFISERMAAEAMELGVSAIVRKPFDVSDLRAAVNAAAGGPGPKNS